MWIYDTYDIEKNQHIQLYLNVKARAWISDIGIVQKLSGLQDICDRAAAALNASTFILSHKTLFSPAAEANSGVDLTNKPIDFIIK